MNNRNSLKQDVKKEKEVKMEGRLRKPRNRRRMVTRAGRVGFWARTLQGVGDVEAGAE